MGKSRTGRVLDRFFSALRYGLIPLVICLASVLYLANPVFWGMTTGIVWALAGLFFLILIYVRSLSFGRKRMSRKMFMFLADLIILALIVVRPGFYYSLVDQSTLFFISIGLALISAVIGIIFSGNNVFGIFRTNREKFRNELKYNIGPHIRRQLIAVAISILLCILVCSPLFSGLFGILLSAIGLIIGCIVAYFLFSRAGILASLISVGVAIFLVVSVIYPWAAVVGQGFSYFLTSHINIVVGIFFAVGALVGSCIAEAKLTD